jgi:hypothetical protein
MDASIFASDLCEAQSSCHSSPPLNTHYTQEEEEEGIPRASGGGGDERDVFSYDLQRKKGVS